MELLYTSVRPFLLDKWWSFSHTLSEYQDIIETFDEIAPSWTKLGNTGLYWRKVLYESIHQLQFDLLQFALSVYSHQRARESYEIERYILQALKLFERATTKTLLAYVRQFDPTVHAQISSVLLKMALDRRIAPKKIKNTLFWVLYQHKKSI